MRFCCGCCCCCCCWCWSTVVLAGVGEGRFCDECYFRGAHVVVAAAGVRRGSDRGGGALRRRRRRIGRGRGRQGVGRACITVPPSAVHGANARRRGRKSCARFGRGGRRRCRVGGYQLRVVGDGVCWSCTPSKGVRRVGTWTDRCLGLASATRKQPGKTCSSSVATLAEHAVKTSFSESGCRRKRKGKDGGKCALCPRLSLSLSLCMCVCVCVCG